MDTFTTTRTAATASAHCHHADHGFCTVCGTAWPCWRALRENPRSVTVRASGPPLLASVAIGAW